MEAQEIKIAKWLCECGEYTPQPEGEGVKIITHCKCGKELLKLQEADGSIIEYVPAPDWFITEFNAQQQETMRRDHALAQAQGSYFSLLMTVIPDLQEKLKNARNKEKNMLEQAMRRMKLSKRIDISWGYNPMMKKFLGWKKEDLKRKENLKRQEAQRGTGN